MRSLVPVAAIALSASGCYVSDRYLISEPQLAQAAALPAGERAGVAVPAVRARDGRPVFVRADALPAPVATAGAVADSTGRRLVTARRYSPMVTAGAVLTYIGSVASVAGSIGFFASDEPLRLAFGLLALSAEPPMIVGTVLWVLGLNRRPQEARPDQPSLRYLAPEVPVAPTPAPAPTPIIGLRF
ncbi:MAG: hypothetical protein U1A78_21290 [Polyangia bacterium]